MRLIDADALKEKQFGAFGWLAGKDLAAAPTIEAEPVRHGAWVERSDKGVISLTHPYQCNICGRVEMNKEPYCNCGCKMDLED